MTFLKKVPYHNPKIHIPQKSEVMCQGRQCRIVSTALVLEKSLLSCLQLDHVDGGTKTTVTSYSYGEGIIIIIVIS